MRARDGAFVGRNDGVASESGNALLDADIPNAKKRTRKRNTSDGKRANQAPCFLKRKVCTRYLSFISGPFSNAPSHPVVLSFRTTDVSKMLAFG